MQTQFDGKVALITGAARGQGRAHAIRFAEEGADIIAIDLCEQLDSVSYPMAEPSDLRETARLVEGTGRRIVAQQGDVRDFERMKTLVDDGVAELGRLDFVLANAGIATAFGESSRQISAYTDAIDVMLNGVYHTIEAALPALMAHGDGGAIVITSSAAGLKSIVPTFRSGGHGVAGYVAAKHGVVGLMRHYARTLGEKNIRVNSVHPGAVATPMIENSAVTEAFADFPEWIEYAQPLLPVPFIEPVVISEAMVYLCGQAGRSVTGVTLPIDAGWTMK